jgi:O-antigen/teichoic acid export membrane protein
MYSLTKIVVDKLSSIYLSLLSSSLPSFGDLVGRNDRSAIVRVRHQMSVFSLFAMMVIGSGVILLNQDFMALWLGAEQYVGDTVNLVLVLVATFGMLNRVDSMIIDSTMEISQKTIALLVAGGTNITLGLLLMPSLGLVGMAMGTLVGRGIVLIANPAILREFLNVSVVAYFKQLARPLATLGILFVLSLVGGPFLNPDTWLELVAASIGVAVVTAGVGWLVGLSRMDRSLIVARFGLSERMKRLLGV